MNDLSSSEIMLSEIFDDIILGKNITRCFHQLVYDGKLYTELFKERLRFNRFWPLTVENVKVDQIHRIPAFYLGREVCFFGYVCWEIISRDRMYKIWRSEMKDNTGRWKYIIPSGQNKIIWVNINLREKRND